MQNYQKMKKEYEKNKQKLKQANEKTDLVNAESKKVEKIISNLKPNLVNKKNYTISSDQVETITQYILKVKDSTKTIKTVNDLNIIMKEYEKDLKEHNNQVRQLNTTIRNKDVEINNLTEELNVAQNTILKQQNEIDLLKPFKYLWNKFMKFFKNGVGYYKDESYRKVYEEMKKHNVLRQEDINFIENKSAKKRNYEL